MAKTKYFLRTYRNSTLFENHEAALRFVLTKSEEIGISDEGELFIATYGTEGDTDTIKTILAIKHKGKVTVFDNEGSSGSIDEQIRDAINALDFNDTSTHDLQFVTEVKEENGIINVRRGEIKSGDNSLQLSTNGNDIDLQVKCDNKTIVKNQFGNLNVKINEGDKILFSDDNGLQTSVAIVKNENPSDVNVRESYTLQGINGEVLGDVINIYNDSSLFNVYLGHIDDRLTHADASGESVDYEITPGTGDTALVYIVQLSNGKYKLTAINVEDFLLKSEFKDGLNVVNHVVSVKNGDGLEFGNEASENKSLKVKIDNNSENVTIGDNTTANVLTLSGDGIRVDNIQNAIDYASSVINNTIEENEHVTSAALNDLEERKADKTDVEDALNEKADKSELNTLGNDVLKRVTSGNGINVGTFSNNQQSISLKINSSADNALTLDTNGLFLSKTIDAGEY